MNKISKKKLKKYRVKITMVKPYEFVDLWAQKPDVKDSLEAFAEELLITNADKCFHVEVSKA